MFKLKPFFFFFIFPLIVHNAGNVVSGVQGIGDVCPPLYLSSDLSQHSCLLTEAGSCYLRIERPEYAAVSR